jgi:hypothetical protein
MKVKNRDSNYELLRIVSMLLIVLGHVLVNGQVLWQSTGMISVIAKFIEAILIIHVNSFILVTGYYQCKSTFKFKKVVSLNNAVWFYRVTIILILLMLNLIDIDHVTLIKNILPIDLGFYWFINAYLLLYCLSPFLNILISKMNGKTFRKLLFTCFIIGSLIPTFTRQQTFINMGGYSLYNFIFLYFIGAYFRLHKIEIWDYFKINSLKFKGLVYFSLFVFMFVINFSFYMLGCNLLQLGHIANELGSILTNATYAYDNPLVIIGSIMYFLWFGCFTINSKFINKIAPLVFGVYLIHENPYVVQLIYQRLGFGPGLDLNSYAVFLKVILTTIGIFAVCLIIEWIRQLLFKLISKLWISNKIKNKWYKYLEELKSSES